MVNKNGAKDADKDRKGQFSCFRGRRCTAGYLLTHQPTGRNLLALMFGVIYVAGFGACVGFSTIALGF